MVRSHSIIIGLVIFAVFSANLIAGVPSAINYQGRLTDGSGTPVPDNSYSVQFSIYDASVGGTIKWTETQSVTTSDGLFAVLLGSVNSLTDSIFSGPTRYLTIKVGTDPEVVPRTMLITVPWAYRVSTVDGASGGTISGDVDITGKATIGVGNSNIGSGSFVAGANSDANGTWAVISGGNSNIADGNQSAVGGGADNTSTGTESVIAGGSENTASGSQASVGGGSMNYATGERSVISGGSENGASAFGSTVSGGINNVASDSSATVGGGKFNYARGAYSVVSGGGGATSIDSNLADGNYSVICGGRGNVADSSATVGGGQFNFARGKLSVISGGGGLTMADSNSAQGELSTIGGGGRNLSFGNSSTIAGGNRNSASTYGAVGGGSGNVAYINSTVSGGINNTTTADYSTVGGGNENFVGGTYATVPGGNQNVAEGISSFAAGYRAYSAHDGSFVWADNNFSFGFSSSAINEFSVRASGGTRFYSNANLTAGVLLASGGSSWSAVSDSSLKRNIREVDYQEVLNKVADLPISQWSYEAQDESIEHIGPMAQDFYRLFSLGEDEKHINTLDPDGIALAAIKALYKQNQTLEDELTKLKKRLDKIEDKE